jgi:hypothetical protein
MHSFANKSSFGARAISGAYLLLCRPHVAAPGDLSGWGRGPNRQRDSQRHKRR